MDKNITKCAILQRLVFGVAAQDFAPSAAAQECYAALLARITRK